MPYSQAHTGIDVLDILWYHTFKLQVTRSIQPRQLNRKNGDGIGILARQSGNDTAVKGYFPLRSFIQNIGTKVASPVC